jgi:Glutathione S-transferase, N-terminal domain
VTLYTFLRSGTSHRLRIALNLKGLRCEQVAVDLRQEQHLSDDYRRINPLQFVPAPNQWTASRPKARSRRRRVALRCKRRRCVLRQWSNWPARAAATAGSANRVCS